MPDEKRQQAPIRRTRSFTINDINQKFNEQAAARARKDAEEPFGDRERGRIHVLGMGSVGKLLAHSIASSRNAPHLTLIYHRPAYVFDLRDRGKCDLELKSPDGDDSTVSDLDIELCVDEHNADTPNYIPREEIMRDYPNLLSDSPILHLIVTTKAHVTVQSLKPLKHRLGPESTVLLCQNGMGVIEDIFDNIWPESERDARPNFVQCVNTHGVYATGPFSAVHAGSGVMYVSALPPSVTKKAPKRSDPSALVPETTKHLIQSLTSVPALGAVVVPYPNFLQRALEKLAVNCVINPFTALLDCQNGDLLGNFGLTRGMRMILAELSLVFRNLPELKGVPNVEFALSPDRLELAVVNIAKKTAKNISSMLQDTRRGNETEIAYINGYVVRRGEQLGIKPVMNYLMVQLVQGKEQLVSYESDNYLPVGQRSSHSDEPKL